MTKELQREKAKGKYLAPLSIAKFENRIYREHSPESLRDLMNDLLKRALTSNAISLTQITLEMGFNPKYWKRLKEEHPEIIDDLEYAKSIIGTRAQLAVAKSEIKESSVMPYLDDYMDEFKEATDRQHRRAIEKAQASKQEAISLPYQLVQSSDGKPVKQIIINENIHEEITE